MFYQSRETLKVFQILFAVRDVPDGATEILITPRLDLKGEEVEVEIKKSNSPLTLSTKKPAD